MRAWITLALLLAAVAGLGTWVYYRQSDAQTATTAALSELKPKGVSRIRLEHASQASAPEAVVLQRKNDAWHMVEPFKARADPFQVDRLLSVLDLRSSARYPANDLARYGLEPPVARLTIDDQTFAYGAVNTVTREQYVMTREAVYAIPLAQRNALPRGAEALIAKTLFAPGETPVRFELPDLTAELRDGSWVFTPAQDELSADARTAWADRWRQASAVQAVRHDGRAPAGTLTVQLKEGRALEFGILQSEPELVLLRPDEGVQYHFFADAAKRMLSPPATK